VVCAFEQRRSVRQVIDWPVSVWHPKAARFFNGQSVNISQNGTLLELPLKAPVREGQDLEINFPRSESLAKDKGGFSRIKNARIVRVDRSDSLTSATVKVGLAFCEQPEPYATPV
jgi:hypothetical protein